jgi:hypothetical protein
VVIAQIVANLQIRTNRTQLTHIHHIQRRGMRPLLRGAERPIQQTCKHGIDMNYRELQAALKAKGLSAYGKKAELEARLAEANEEPVMADVQKAPERTSENMKNKVMYVYTGDPGIGKEEGWKACDPTWCQMHGYMFKLNGSPVPVAPEVAAKLATHSHFTEKK